MRNANLTKILSWIHLTYQFSNDCAQVKFETSDEKLLEYQFKAVESAQNGKIFTLTDVKGSHIIPCSYQYETKTPLCQLIKENSSVGTRKND